MHEPDVLGKEIGAAEGVWGCRGRAGVGSPSLGEPGGGWLPLLSHGTSVLRASTHTYKKVICFSRMKGSFSCSPLGLICFRRNTYCIEELKATCLEAQLFTPPRPLPCSLPTGGKQPVTPVGR